MYSEEGCLDVFQMYSEEGCLDVFEMYTLEGFLVYLRCRVKRAF